MSKSKNKMSFEVDLDGLETDKSIREQVEDQLEDNGFSEEEINSDDFSNSLDDIYGDDDEDEDETQDTDEDNTSSSADDEDKEAVKQKTSKENEDETQENVDEDGQNNSKKEFGDRANKRIRELNAQKKQAFEEAELARKARFEAEKDAVITKKELIKIKLDGLKRDFELAVNDGDASKQADLNQELIKYTTDLSRIESTEEKYKEYVPQTFKEEGSKNEDVFGVDFDHETALKLANDWEFDNPRVLTDKVFAETSVKIGQQLMQRGFKPDTEDFYSELTSRLNMAFGLTNNQTTKNKQTDNETQQTDGAKVVVAKKNPPQKVQTVAGASRTPSPTNLSGKVVNKNGIRLEREDIELAKQMNVDLKTYAANKARVEKSYNEKGQIKLELFPSN